MMQNKAYDEKQLHELLYQALKTESGGMEIYETAITCALNEDFREELQEYLDQTRKIFGVTPCQSRQ